MTKPPRRARMGLAARAALTFALSIALSGGAALAAAAWYIDSSGIPPRMLAPYIAKRSSGHNPVITGTGARVSTTLAALDRGRQPALPAVFAPPSAPAPRPAALRAVIVSTSDGLTKAMASALPGDVITLLPGAYRFEGGALYASRPGSAAAPIVVRAGRPGSVRLDFALVEGFLVTAPYWRFENLDIAGACAEHHQCEHAFHVVGEAHHFAAVGNTVTDFNSHFKINELQGRFPDHGLVEGNIIRNNSARRTDSPVSLVDLVAASGWTIRANRISNFIKDGGDQTSYGAFAKGAGSGNVIERNIVVCEERPNGTGRRVGLSLGGGGTGPQYCRDGRCITEQDGGIIRANLVASCSDDGIYLNKAASSTVEYNTLLDTGGMVVRFAQSSATVEGNLVDGTIRVRDGGLLHPGDNRQTSAAWLYAGYHPVRALFGDGLTWNGDAPRRKGGASAPDLCGTARPERPAYGAFEDFGACRR
ncbi:MAG: right-handed parallel beta-helix repeat-containing protein [Telluria sp.]